VIDHQQAAAGERPEDFASEREKRNYWIDRCFENLNASRAAQGLSPYVRQVKSLQQAASRTTLQQSSGTGPDNDPGGH
jgi:hypothetical protein